MNTTYQVIDIRTKQVVGTFKNKQAARNKRDRLDLEYGAVRYTVHEMASVMDRFAPIVSPIPDLRKPGPYSPPPILEFARQV